MNNYAILVWHVCITTWSRKTSHIPWMKSRKFVRIVAFVLNWSQSFTSSRIKNLLRQQNQWRELVSISRVPWSRILKTNIYSRQLTSSPGSRSLSPVRTQVLHRLSDHSTKFSRYVDIPITFIQIEPVPSCLARSRIIWGQEGSLTAKLRLIIRREIHRLSGLMTQYGRQ